METQFNSININHTDINQSLLNIESKTRSNLFSWNGQFTPQFVETMLSTYGKNGFTVLDPFVGSGTTLCESARQGMGAFGTELNISAYYIAKLYELINNDLYERMNLISEINKIISSLNKETPLEDLEYQIKANDNSQISNILKALVILLDIYNHDPTIENIKKKWETITTKIINFPYSKEIIHSLRGDARSIQLNNNSIDMLFTSPPYINVFNYHQKYRKSVESLGYNVLNIAKSEIGSNRKYRENRLFTVIQYCIDMALSLYEASRICKENARMIYVVGRESTVLGYSFCNSELIYNLGTQILNLPLILRQERFFKNRYGQLIYEDILHFENKHITLNEEDIVKAARKIAVAMLESKLSSCQDNNKNKDYILAAINKAEKVLKSEVSK